MTASAATAVSASTLATRPLGSTSTAPITAVATSQPPASAASPAPLSQAVVEHAARGDSGAVGEHDGGGDADDGSRDHRQRRQRRRLADGKRQPLAGARARQIQAVKLARAWSRRRP